MCRGQYSGINRTQGLDSGAELLRVDGVDVEGLNIRACSRLLGMSICIVMSLRGD